MLTPEGIAVAPDRPAIVFGPTGAVTTHGALDARSPRVARALDALGLSPGDGVVLENRPELLEVAWGARRAGLYYTPVNTHLTREEVAYIVRDHASRIV